ncbi:MAG: hypothetical protein L0956_04345 [Candidatus Mariimomonas ferrooxydans]
MFYISEKDPKLDPERWGFAFKTIPYKRDSRLVSAVDEKPAGRGSYFNTGTFRRLNIISQPWPEKGGIESLCLNLYVRTGDPEDVLLVRLRDSGVPSRIWAHAEVKLEGFNGKKPGLLSLTFDMTDLALAPGDRLWLDVCSATGTEILVGDKEKPSALIVETIPLKDALPEYSPKEIFAARASWWKHGELALWRGNVEGDYLKPKVWCGNFNTLYPMQAVRRVEPNHEEAQYLWENANGMYSFYVLRDKERNTYYNIDTYPKSRIIELDIPEGVPAWAVYMKPYLEFREEMGNYWADRQNPDGQYGGGYNDDATELIGTLIDVPLNGNQKVINAVNKWRNLFDKTRIMKDGYENVYPQDPHHTKDIAYGVRALVKINLGNAYRMEKAMEVAWHYGRPDRTPMHYAHRSPNFSYGWKAVRWYWGLLKPEEPYVGMNREELMKHLKYWYSTLNSTVRWYYKQDHEFGGINITGSVEFRKIFHGGDPQSEFFAVYWPKGLDPDITRVVDYADDTSLKARFYSFDDNERTLTVRLCRLKKGKYSIVLAPDMNNDGKPDGNPAGKIINLRRFSDIVLTIPSKTPLALSITQIESYGDPGHLPDLAVDPEDIRVSNNFITVTVHNLGNAPADGIKVTLLVNGKPLETKIAEHIDAPVDLKPKFYTLYFMDFRSSGEVVEAIVDPDNTIEEIYEGNNRSVAADYRGDDYFDWTDIPYVP